MQWWRYLQMNGRGHKINQRSQQFWLRWHMHQETLSLRNINIIYTFISGTHWHLNFWSFWRLKFLSLSRASCCNRSTLTPLFPLLYKKYYKIWSKNIKRIYFIFFTLNKVFFATGFIFLVQACSAVADKVFKALKKKGKH